MKQLVKLPALEEEFEKRGVALVAVANEEGDMAEHAKIRDHFGGVPPFRHAPDFQGRATRPYGRTTSYLIDRRGTVRQVFPMEIYERPPWWAFLNEIDALAEAEEEAVGEG